MFRVDSALELFHPSGCSNTTHVSIAFDCDGSLSMADATRNMALKLGSSMQLGNWFVSESFANSQNARFVHGLF